MKTHLLKLERDDPQRELEFTVRCSLEEDPESRLEQWYHWNLDILDLAKQAIQTQRGYKETPAIIKRL